jgi:GAF domain-containing protein
MQIESSALRSALARLGSASIEGGVQPALQAVCDATAQVFDVAGAGLMIIDDSQVLRYVAATDEPGRVLERVQEATGQGPCVDALVSDVLVTTPDVSCDERWPETALLMGETPVRAVLGVPAHVAGGAVGSLNVYRTTVQPWDATEVDALKAFNTVIENLLAAAVLAEARDEIARQLQYALDHRVTIERAVGVIMGRDRVDPVTAFNVLRSHARSQRRKVADLAAEILEAFGQPTDDA